MFNDASLDHEYLPIAGTPSYTRAAAKLILGEASPAIKENRVAAVQTISGTGSIHTGAMFLSQFYKKSHKCYISKPTWGKWKRNVEKKGEWIKIKNWNEKQRLIVTVLANHRNIFALVGFEVEDYPYWNPETRGLDYGRMIETMRNAPNGSIFILHACAHNPTG